MGWFFEMLRFLTVLQALSGFAMLTARAGSPADVVAELEKIQQEIKHDIDSAILRELVENGSLDVLWEILTNVADEKTNATIDEITEIQQADDMWKLAYEEYQSFVTTKKSAQQEEDSELKIPTFDELLHDSSLRNIRSILQSFGNDE